MNNTNLIFNGFNPVLIIVAWVLFLVWIVTEVLK